MSFSQKLIVIMLMACMVIGIIYVGQSNNLAEEESKKMSYYQTETLHLWYTDDAFTDFFTNAAVEFHDQNPDIRVIPTLVSSAEYIERINEASLSNEEFPDLYVLTNDSLEKAYLSGLASQVRDSQHVLNINHFGKGALFAVNYNGLSVAYPLNFDTTILLYNKTYLNDWVEKVNAGEKVEAENGDELDENGNVISQSEAVSDTVVSLEDYIPETFDDIISFAEEYKAADGVESILQWDVTDIFYNYLFVGYYMIVGGDAGDNSENINIINDNTLESLHAYQNLSQVFSIDAETSDYDSVLKDFLEGKTVFTIVTTDALATVEQAIADRQEEIRILSEANALDSEDAEQPDTTDIPRVFEYGYAPVPDVSATLKSRSLSVTNTLVINGYSEKKDAANKFATFVSTDYADQIYLRTGKMAASTDAGYTDTAMLAFQAEYADSVPLPKIVEASNLWVQLEIAFTDIWSGQDVRDRLTIFADQINSQILSQ